VNNKTAIMNGTFDLTKLDDIRMSLDINVPEPFMVMNTTQASYSLYYWKSLWDRHGQHLRPAGQALF
jgi:hypothetical protein